LAFVQYTSAYSSPVGRPRLTRKSALVLLACWMWPCHAIEQENVPGRWHLETLERYCRLMLEGRQSTFSIVLDEHRHGVFVALTGGRKTENKSHGLGTIAPETPGRVWGLLDRFQQMTLPFTMWTTPRGNESYAAVATREEFRGVLGAVERAAGDAKGALWFRYGDLEERFPTGSGGGKDKVAEMRACADKQ